MTRDQVIKKVRRCLALSASQNEHEAAAALRQAHALMRKYNIEAKSVDASYVTDAHVEFGGDGERVMPHLATLVGAVSDAMECRVVRMRVPGFPSSVVFLGIDPKPELAAYTYSVLRRRLERDRAAYVATLTRCCRATKIRRGRVFARAWVMSVSNEVARFATQDPEVQRRLDAYWDEHYRNAPAAKLRKSRAKAEDAGAALAGEEMGQRVKIHNAVGKTPDARHIGTTVRY